MTFNFRSLLPWILCAILSVFLFMRPKELVAVKIPGVSGSFRALDPQPLKVEAPETESIVSFEALPRAEMIREYTEATSIRTYEEVFKDSVQTIKAKATVKGSLESLELTYETRPREVELEVKKGINLYIGGTVSISPEGQSYRPSAYVVTNKLLFNAGYDLITKAPSVGVAIKIF